MKQNTLIKTIFSVSMILFSSVFYPHCTDANSSDHGVFKLVEKEARPGSEQNFHEKPISGAEQLGLYIPKLRGKRVGAVVNHSSMIGPDHLIDTLLALEVDLRKVFAPEHGFRGDVADGELISDSRDAKTGLPIISLYGRNKKPTPAQLEDLDVIVFDIQDVGVRFYTYLSTLHYIMEAAAEAGKQVIVLDRPNPNGYYVDGPVLQSEHSSFVGLHPVPVVYGMTIGEYAQMINGESWLENGVQCVLDVIPLMNYNRALAYRLERAPSPNLPNAEAVLLYPSLAFFEGTTVSIGRGTEQPFQVIGHPEYGIGSFLFRPQSVQASPNPKWKGKDCFGVTLEALSFDEIASWKKLNLGFLVGFHNFLKDKSEFFRPDGYFEKLAGTNTLRTALIEGQSEDEIRLAWESELNNFRRVRSKYLIYADFE